MRMPLEDEVWHRVMKSIKIKDGCVTCPLHQTRYDLTSGEVKEWSPFPFIPIYGKIVGKLRRPSPLAIHMTRELDGWIEVKLNS